jgi:hypothetical protein
MKITESQLRRIIREEAKQAAAQDALEQWKEYYADLSSSDKKIVDDFLKAQIKSGKGKGKKLSEGFPGDPLYDLPYQTPEELNAQMTPDARARMQQHQPKKEADITPALAALLPGFVAGAVAGGPIGGVLGAIAAGGATLAYVLYTHKE